MSFEILDENTRFGYRIQTTRCFHLIPYRISRFTLKYGGPQLSHQNQMLTANSNRSQQIQTAHSKLQIAHNKFKSLTANYKSLTAN